MNFAVRASVDAEAAAEVRVGARADEGSNKNSTNQLVYEKSLSKGGEQYATGR